MCQSQPISNQSRVRLALVVLIMIAASPLAKTTSKLCKDKVLLLTGPGGFPDISVGKESACIAGDPGSIPRLGRSAGEGIGYPLQYSWASFMAQLVNNPPAMRETWVPSLGWEDHLEKGKATHSSIPAQPILLIMMLRIQ